MWGVEEAFRDGSWVWEPKGPHFRAYFMGSISRAQSRDIA